MVNIKYLIHHSIIKKQISNITEMGVLNSRSLLQKKKLTLHKKPVFQKLQTNIVRSYYYFSLLRFV